MYKFKGGDSFEDSFKYGLLGSDASGFSGTNFQSLQKSELEPIAHHLYCTLTSRST